MIIKWFGLHGKVEGAQRAPGKSLISDMWYLGKNLEKKIASKLKLEGQERVI